MTDITQSNYPFVSEIERLDERIDNIGGGDSFLAGTGYLNCCIARYRQSKPVLTANGEFIIYKGTVCIIPKGKDANGNPINVVVETTEDYNGTHFGTTMAANFCIDEMGNVFNIGVAKFQFVDELPTTVSQGNTVVYYSVENKIKITPDYGATWNDYTPCVPILYMYNRFSITTSFEPSKETVLLTQDNLARSITPQIANTIPGNRVYVGPEKAYANGMSIMDLVSFDDVPMASVRVMIEYVCTVADGGYVAGDVIKGPLVGTATSDRLPAIYYSTGSSFIIIKFPATASAVGINPSTGAAISFTVGRWNVRAVYFY